MKHRILALSALLLTLTGTAAVAQAPQGPPPGGMGQGPGQGGPNRRMAALLNGITLTPAQQAKMDSINTKYQAMGPQMTPGTPPDSATRATMMANRTKRDAELRAVLTTEQQAIWDRNMAAMPQRPPRP